MLRFDWVHIRACKELLLEEQYICRIGDRQTVGRLIQKNGDEKSSVWMLWYIGKGHVPYSVKMICPNMAAAIFQTEDRINEAWS